MEIGKLIEENYPKRMEQILEKSWKIFKSQFVNGRIEINKEAPFQHHFAQIIKSVGDLYAINKEDLFRTDLETKCENVKEKSKYIDITCGFLDRYSDKYKTSCAIELKFKTKVQAAQDVGRVDAYVDIEALEKIVIEKKDYDLGKFYMITDYDAYTKPFKGKSAEDFKTHHKHTTEAEKEFIHSHNWKGLKGAKVFLKNSYTFNWEKIDKDEQEWYFLELTVKQI